MIVMWGGYSFSKGYKKPRGHFYAVTDVRNILRTGAPMDANSGPLNQWLVGLVKGLMYRV